MKNRKTEKWSQGRGQQGGWCMTAWSLNAMWYPELGSRIVKDSSRKTSDIRIKAGSLNSVVSM